MQKPTMLHECYCLCKSRIFFLVLSNNKKRSFYKAPFWFYCLTSFMSCTFSSDWSFNKYTLDGKSFTIIFEFKSLPLWISLPSKLKIEYATSTKLWLTLISFVNGLGKTTKWFLIILNPFSVGRNPTCFGRVTLSKRTRHLFVVLSSVVVLSYWKRIFCI